MQSHRTLAAAVTVLGTVSVSTADVIHVFPDGSGDAPTIAAAYAMAVIGDEISLGPGTYYEHDIPMSSVPLYSASDNPLDTIIDAQGLGRCLYGPGVTGAVPFRSVTLQNGRHAERGGLLLAGQGGTGGGHYVSYQNCIFRNGSAPFGGAVAVGTTSGGQAPHFYDCLFEGNEADATDGGAIWTGGVGSATGCTFRNNSAAGRGGAVYSVKQYTWGFETGGCVFEGNTAELDGGAIFSEGTDDLYGSWIWSCTFVGNVARNGGAARLNEYDLVESSTFLDNEALVSGGALVLVGILPDKDSYGDYRSNVFARNRAGSAGGALWIGGSQVTFWIDRCTFVENGAPSGGHYWGSRSPVFRRTILAFGTDGGAAAGPANSSTSCLDVFGNVGGDWVGPLGGEGSEPTNLSADPLFCDLPNGDYTIREDSPCAPGHGGDCGQIGRYGVGCSAISVVPESWGRIKSRYR